MSKQVLVTRISGFIAKHVALALPRRGWSTPLSDRRALRRLLLAPILAAGSLAPMSVAAAQEQEAQEDAQKPDLEAFGFLVGGWEGELEYLDYGDDSTLVRLPTRLTCARDSTGQVLRLEFAYREPDGRTMTGTEELRLLDEPGWISLGDPWKIEELTSDPGAGEYRLVLSRHGEDNGRSADIKNSVLRTGDELTITKQVRYDGAEVYFRRHQYRFRRADETVGSDDT